MYIYIQISSYVVLTYVFVEVPVFFLSLLMLVPNLLQLLFSSKLSYLFSHPTLTESVTHYRYPQEATTTQSNSMLRILMSMELTSEHILVIIIQFHITRRVDEEAQQLLTDYR